jgi:hypothetical protein
MELAALLTASAKRPPREKSAKRNTEYRENPEDTETLR